MFSTNPFIQFSGVSSVTTLIINESISINGSLSINDKGYPFLKSQFFETSTFKKQVAFVVY